MNLHHQIPPRVLKIKPVRLKGRWQTDRDSLPPINIRAELAAGFMGMALVLAVSWFVCALWFGA